MIRLEISDRVMEDQQKRLDNLTSLVEALKVWKESAAEELSKVLSDSPQVNRAFVNSNSPFTVEISVFVNAQRGELGGELEEIGKKICDSLENATGKLIVWGGPNYKIVWKGLTINLYLDNYQYRDPLSLS